MRYGNMEMICWRNGMSIDEGCSIDVRRCEMWNGCGADNVGVKHIMRIICI